MNAWKGIIAEYSDFLPFGADSDTVTLLEGNTPLIYSSNLSKKTGASVYLKFDGANPTGSFKDRGMTVAITKAKKDGANAVICASTGNTSASAAAYAARCGLRCYVLIPSGKIAGGKMAQVIAHGANVVAIDGNFDQALELVKKISSQYLIALVNSLNPFRIEGQKTAAFEVCDVLGRSPDYLFIPVGNAGNITSYWKGFREYRSAGRIKSVPKMCGFQAAGAAPIYYDRKIDGPETIATAIRIGNPARWQEAKAAMTDSGGMVGIVTDEEIMSAYFEIATYDGIFAEPASAASVAGLLKRSDGDRSLVEKLVVCVLTGHGLKDPDSAVKFGTGFKTAGAEMSSVLSAIGL
jgi:threonine synthase